MRNTKHFILAIVLFLGMSARVYAVNPVPEQENARRIQGYFFVAPAPIYQGNTVQYRGTSAHMGGGANFLFYEGIGAGAELGYFTVPKEVYFIGENVSAGMGVFSANGCYFPFWKRKLSPFGTLGYSLNLGEGGTNFVNFGGGVNYWMNANLGLLIEFRTYQNHKKLLDSSWNIRIISVRFGLSFR